MEGGYFLRTQYFRWGRNKHFMNKFSLFIAPTTVVMFILRNSIKDELIRVPIGIYVEKNYSNNLKLTLN